MSTLQWALLLLGVGIAGMLIWSSRRERKALERLNTPPQPSASRDWGMEREPMAAPAPPSTEAKPSSGAHFDEFGVGKPRKVGNTLPPGTKAPDLSRRPPELGTPPPPAPAVENKVIGLYIAEHEGTNILGPKIHAALQARGLRFGTKKIYHRLENDQPIFSVASLTKPGSLDPAEAEGFATPGLSVFLVLPGPARPVAALQDMLDTARGLAKALNAELYDSEQRAPLTTDRERELHLQVEDWAKRNTPAGRLSV